MTQCAHCGRDIEDRRRRPGAAPAFCHRSVSPECYNAYRKWRYDNDAAYKTSTLARHSAWKRARTSARRAQ